MTGLQFRSTTYDITPCKANGKHHLWIRQPNHVIELKDHRSEGTPSLLLLGNETWLSAEAVCKPLENVSEILGEMMCSSTCSDQLQYVVVDILRPFERYGITVSVQRALTDKII